MLKGNHFYQNGIMCMQKILVREQMLLARRAGGEMGGRWLCDDVGVYIEGYIFVF